MSQHLNEEQLQRYAEQYAFLSSAAQLHLTQCAECQLKANNYRILDQELKAMPQLGFGFGFEEMVLNALPAQQQTLLKPALEKEKTYKWIPGLAACIGICLIAIAIIQYAGNLVDLFSVLPRTWLWMAIMPAAVILPMQLFALTKEYQRKMKQISSM